MRPALLDILRCPHCGVRPVVIENAAVTRSATGIETGVLGCECCAFPIVAGIPVMIAAPATEAAMHRLEGGDADGALFALLGLEDDAARAAAFRRLLARGDEATYRDAIGVLSPDAEGQYFVYRFSDPTFVLAEAVLEAVTRHPAAASGRAIDVCGGSGHLTYALGRLLAPGAVTLADVFFWKLWLARRFTAPECDAVCCDANVPLPLARDAFSLVVCSDAFPYIWQKRLLAEEMMRLAGPGGIVALPHVHSALGENVSAGMTLTPAAYKDLFAPLGARVFGDGALLRGVLDGSGLDFTREPGTEELAGEASLTIVATHNEGVFRAYPAAAPVPRASGVLTVNPLYRVERRHGLSVLTLDFPTPEYEAEFAACKDYLPATVSVPADVTVPFDAAALGEDYEELRRRRVILDLPARYC